MSQLPPPLGQNMLDFDLTQLSVADISEISPGDFFIWEGSEKPVLSVLLTPPSGQGADAFLMTLAGSQPFLIHVVDTTYRDRVLPLKLDPKRLRLRFDPSSPIPQPYDHQLGRIVFSTNSGGAISAAFANPRSHGRRPLIYLEDWRIGNATEPRFVFKCWTLSYESETFGWIDLATNIDIGNVPSPPVG